MQTQDSNTCRNSSHDLTSPEPKNSNHDSHPHASDRDKKAVICQRQSENPSRGK